MERVLNWVFAAWPEKKRLFHLQMGLSPLVSRLIRGTFWLVSGAVISRLLGLLGSVIMARLLGKIGFGELGIVQSTVGMVGTFAGLGIGITATKYVAQWRETEPLRCGRVIGFALSMALIGGVIASFVLLLASDWLAVHTLASPKLGGMLRLGIWLIFFGALQGAYLGVLSGFEAFRQASWVNWCSSLVGMPVIIVCTWLFDLSGAILALVLQAAFSCILGHWALMKETAKAQVKISYQLNSDEWRLLLRFTLPVFISTMLASQAGWISRTILVNQPDGYSETALVNAANQWMNLVNFLPWTMGSVLVPIFANLHATGQRDEFMKLLRQNILINLAIGITVGGSLILCSPIIMGFYGSGFNVGGSIFNMTMVCGVIVTINNLFSRTLQCAGLAWLDLVSNILWASAVVFASFPLIHWGKGFGIVTAHATGAVVLLFWQWLVIRGMFFKAGPKI